jgi:hypothetical protein
MESRIRWKYRKARLIQSREKSDTLSAFCIRRKKCQQTVSAEITKASGNSPEAFYWSRGESNP